MSNNVLFVTHRKTQCGVYEFGINTFNAISGSLKYRFIHIECDSLSQLESAIVEHSPDFIIYNYHPSVMPWICTKITKGVSKNNLSLINITQIGIIHEVTQEISNNATSYRNKYILGAYHKRLNSLFDYYIAADPTLLLKNPFVYKTGRLLSEYKKTIVEPNQITIGSFGFATPNKGFEKLVSKVRSEFDEAIIRINMPFASFGDIDGANAKKVANNCRQILVGSKIKLEITNDYLSSEQLLDFLASNSINVFMYDDIKGRGISSVLDFALSVKKPIAISNSSMFRHLLHSNPEVSCDNNSLKSILNIGTEALKKTISGWDSANLVWEYERILDAILKRKFVVEKLKVGVKRKIKSWINKLLTRPGISFTWLGNTNAVTDDDLNKVTNSSYTPVNFSLSDGFNRILDDQARALYAPAISKLIELAPATMSKKIARANIQQAFIFDSVYRHLKNYNHPKLLCVGSYEDTASMALQKLGIQVEEIDPMVNYFLQEFVTKPTTIKNSYDIIFSTSVIEHDPDDESFIKCIEELLAPGGLAVITCDYKDGWEYGQPKPEVDERFYTKSDLLSRLPSYIPNCTLLDIPDWDCPVPDFKYLDIYIYTFATFAFRKNY